MPPRVVEILEFDVGLLDRPLGRLLVARVQSRRQPITCLLHPRREPTAVLRAYPAGDAASLALQTNGLAENIANFPRS